MGTELSNSKPNMLAINAGSHSLDGSLPELAVSGIIQYLLVTDFINKAFPS